MGQRSRRTSPKTRLSPGRLPPGAPRARPPRHPRRPPAWLWIALLALAVRVVYLLEWRHNPLFANPKVDELYNVEWARAMAAGRDYVGGPYYRAPLYAAFLSLMDRLFGPSYLVPRIAQAILDAATCVLTWQVGRTLYGRAAGMAAGLVAATWWMLVFYTGELLDTTLAVFLVTLAVAIMLRAASPASRGERWSHGWWIGGGIVLGLAADTRPTALALVPLFVGWALWLRRGRGRTAWRPAALLAAGCALAVAPVTLRNAVVGHDRVLIATSGGVNFYVGNNPESDGRTASEPGGGRDLWGRYDTSVLDGGSGGTPRRQSEASDYYYRLGWSFITEHPGDAARLTLLKARLFWSRWEIANEQNAYFWTRRFAPVMRVLALRFSLLGPLGLLGLALVIRRSAEHFPPAAVVLGTMAGTVPFFCPARYRMPMIPMLIVLATAAVFECVRTARHREWRRGAAYAAILAVLALLVNVTPHREPGDRDFISWTMLGDAWDEAGRAEDALASYRRALAIVPGDIQATAGLGRELTALNRLPGGIDAFRLALRSSRPRRAGDTPGELASIHSNLANALVQTGAIQDAVPEYRAAIELNPAGGQGSDQYNLGLVLQALGRKDEARAAFEAALAVAPGFTPAREALARLAATSEAGPEH